MTDEFVELHGDRLFGDDAAIVAGLARLDGRRIVVVGQQKGADTDENIRRNFGMPHPRATARRCGSWSSPSGSACRSSRSSTCPAPIPARSPRSAASPRRSPGRSALMTRLRTPIVTVITGEGGSGGALAIAVGDVVIALENAVYSVISPEGCASILWRTPDEAPDRRRRDADDGRRPAATSASSTSSCRSPASGAHTDPAETARRLRAIIVDRLDGARRRSPSTTWSRRATGATGPWARTLRSTRRTSRRRPSAASPIACATCSDPAGGPIGGAPSVVVARRAAGPRGGLASARVAARRTRAPTRSAAERAADHAAIDRLAGELLPALIAKLGATGLGELEVREGDWQRPAAPARRRRRRGQRAPRDRAAARAAGHGHAHPDAVAHGAAPGRAGPRRPRRLAPAADGRPRSVRDVAGRRHLPAAARGRGRHARSGPATGSASSTCSACPRRSSRRSTASSARASSRRARPSSTARSSIVIELRRRRRRRTA